MASFEPAFLPIGTDVSAKYRGAFCEAKVKKLVKSVKCKIILKDTQVSVVVTDENITGPLKVGSTVEVKLPESGQQSEGIINKITDCSTYTVVFDDGDERTLRRTQLCLKGEKHFMESETLDNLPLSHPEHFGTPVLQNKKSRRTKPGEESESEEEMSSSEEETPRRASYKGRYQELVGKVMCMECTDKRKGGQCPVLVVLPDAHPMDVKPRDQLLVRSFRDAKFMYASRKELKEFSREIAIKNEDKNMKAAFEKALLYYDNHELPPNWKKQELLGSEDEDEGGDDDSSDDNEPSEQKDLFVAQLYKFMDDRSTPINKGPCIGNKDLNLYRLFRVVQAIGGYNKVTNQMKWRLVYSKMGLPPSNTASHQIKNAYKKYLHAFEDFYRKLGSTMGTISRPGRSRQSSSRSILAFRGRDKEPSPRSPRTEKTTVKDDKSKDEEKEKPKIKSDEGPRSEDTEDAGESTPVDESDTDIVRRSTPRREKAQKEEPAKIDKEKKEDVKIKKEDKKEEEKKEEKKDEKKDEKKEDVKEEKKKEDKREERKSLRQSLKEEERKEAGKGKEEDKKDVKKGEGRTDRVLRREREDKEDEGKKEGEEQKDNQKKRVTRRKSGRTEDDKKEGEDKEEKEEEKKVSEEKMNAEKKDKAEDKKERKDELKRPPSARKEKKTEIKKKPEDEEQPEKKDKDSEKPEEVESEADSASDNHNQDEYPAGTKLKVKYGRGRNQKIYEAKVVEAGKEGQHKNYLVHYAGWNTRYDEWVRPDRIVSVVDRPEMTKLKKKSMSPRSPKTTTKPDMPVLKKRGRNSLQQDQSPGNASAKMPVSSDGKTPKNKPPTTPGGSASKTRTTRSNSTEIKSEGLQAPAKNRITRRSSGLTDSMDAGSPGDQDVGSDSEPESEMAAPSGSGGDLVSERDDEDEGKEMELDTSIEEEETSDMKEVEDEPITSVEEADMDESRSEEPLAEEASEDNKDMPHIVPKDDSQENLLELSSLVLPDDSTITPLLADEENNDVTEGTKEDTTSLPEITKTSLEQQGTEESDEKLDESLPVLSQQTEEESAAKEVDTSNSSENPELDTKSETLPMPDNSDEDKNSSYEELAIPQLKKIDIDIVPVSEKREAKLDKVKSKKKDGKESKKGRQTEHRASFSEIPTLEPMTVVPDVKPCPSEVEPSPYDFNEPELDLPWQPEITKKWEPINKPHPVFRDGKIEFKKSMETEKKKVKKKTKKAPCGDGDEKSPSKEASEKVESPAKDETASEPQQDKPVKKKGRKKKELSPDLKKEIQTYEDVVNSVVESYSTPEPEHVPFSPCAEKEEKPVKKRKNKSAENAESPSKMDTTKDTTESEKKQQGKGPKKIKGGKVVKKLNKKAKEGNSLEEGDSQPSDPVSLSFFPLDGQESVHSSNTPREKRARSHSPESSSFKQPRWDLGSLQTVGSTGASPLGSPAPKPASSSVVLPKPASNIATPRAGSSTSAAAVGLEEVQVVPVEGPANVLSGSGLEARLECAVNLPRQGAAVANTVLDNTPPTTPENDLDEVHSASSDSHDNLKDDMESLDSGERTSKGGSESPPCCDLSVSSASNEALPSSKCVPQSSKGSELETSVKRKRTIDECALVKKKKRTNSARSTRAERHRKSPKYGDEDTLSRSSMDQISVSEQLVSGPISPSKTENNKVDHIRPPKFHFCDDLGEHLEGEQRINFLMSKMIEIRKEYARIKAEIAAIDRRRKRHRRKEKESSQASQSEMEKETS